MEACNNQVLLRGTVAGEAALSHEAHGIPFYRVPLAVPRLSGREDRVNLLCPHAGPEDPLPPPGAYVEVSGEVRSFNNRSGVGSRLVITVLAREIRPGLGEPCNRVTLCGALCKPPVLLQVLGQCPAEEHIDHLHPSAHSKDRLFLPDELPAQRPFQTVPP